MRPSLTGKYSRYPAFILILAASLPVKLIHAQEDSTIDHIQTLDGLVSPIERRAATDSLVGEAARVLVQDDGLLVRISVLADSIAVASLCLGNADRVLVLHASAALGLLDFRREGLSWTTDETFVWAMRDTAMTAATQEVRRAQLDDHGWVATTYQMGRFGETEFLIDRDLLPDGDIYLAIGIMRMPKPMEIIGLPSESAGDCARGDLVRGPAPLTGLRFEPETWKQIRDRH